MAEGSPQDMRGVTADEMRKLSALAHLSKVLNGATNVEELLGQALDMARRTLEAERGCIMLNSTGHDLEVRKTHCLHPQVFEMTEFCALTEQVAQGGRPLLSQHGERSAMCAPLRSGVIYLDRQSAAGAFTATDLEVLALIAGMAGAALERAQHFADLLQQEKMTALGTIMSGLAHELNSPLTSIIGFTSLSLATPEDADSVTENLNIIATEAERCRLLVAELLQCSRSPGRRLQDTDVAQLTERVRRLTRAEFVRDQVTLDVEVDADLALPGEPERLTQVLLHLLHNARLVVRGRREARVSLRATRTERGVDMQVADNGPGIETRVLSRIFDPFFTTRPLGDGAGLGLSIVQRIVQDHGGTVRAHNQPSGGAVFTVHLPACPDVVAISA